MRILIIAFISKLLLHSLIAEGVSAYRINEEAYSSLRGKDAMLLLTDYFKENPHIAERMLNPQYVVPDEAWGYYSQTYRDANTMQHLIALQIKAMAERKAVKSINQIFDEEYGIGSKSHKDKGTINNVFSFWGHPVHKEILQKNRFTVIKVYTLFRETLKNQLIAFARNQTLEWHQSDTATKLDATIHYLEKNFPDKTQILEEGLKEMNLDLRILLKKTIETNLLSAQPSNFRNPTLMQTA